MDKQFFELRRASKYTQIFANKESALSACKDHYPTGFKSLDEATGGGLAEGFCLLGADPGAGKSTFLFQLGYHYAKDVPVIVFSLEVRREDVIAKYISMETFTENTTDPRYAVDSQTLRRKDFICNVGSEHWTHIKEACARVTDRIQNMFIFDITDNVLDVDNITSVVDEFIKIYGKKPIVIIDYLQYLREPASKKYKSDKERLDYSLSTLFSLANQKRLLVLLISSFDKKNFNNDKSDMSGFCGTSRIAYDADMLMTLYYHNADNIDVERDKEIREIDLKIVKQRFGKAGKVINLAFYAGFNYFADAMHSKAIEQVKKEEPPFIQQKLEFL